MFTDLRLGRSRSPTWRCRAPGVQWTPTSKKHFQPLQYHASIEASWFTCLLYPITGYISDCFTNYNIEGVSPSQKLVNLGSIGPQHHFWPFEWLPSIDLDIRKPVHLWNTWISVCFIWYKSIMGKWIHFRLSTTEIVAAQPVFLIFSFWQTGVHWTPFMEDDKSFSWTYSEVLTTQIIIEWLS